MLSLSKNERYLLLRLCSTRGHPLIYSLSLFEESIDEYSLICLNLCSGRIVIGCTRNLGSTVMCVYKMIDTLLTLTLIMLISTTEMYFITIELRSIRVIYLNIGQPLARLV